MKLIVTLFLAAMVYGADLRIDHVTVAGKNLAGMKASLEAAGIKCEPGGPHTNHATEMAIASFPDGSYIELIALQHDFDPTMLAKHPWAKLMQGEAGPAAWAIRPKNFAAETARLEAAKVPVKVVQGGRTRPDGVALEWENAEIGSEGLGVFLPFLIRDKTPREKRAFPSGKAANRDVTGVFRVVIAVRKLADAVERLQSAYPDLGKPLKQVDSRFGAELAWFADSPVILASPLRASSWLVERMDEFGEGPCAFVLGARKQLKQPWASEGRWFGREVKWTDPTRLGWRLGIEQP